VILTLLCFLAAGWQRARAQALPSAGTAAGHTTAAQTAGADSTAQAAPEAAPPPPPPPVDPLGRTSPHGCVLGFLRAAEAKDYEKAGQYLDGKRSPQQAGVLAEELKYLLDLGLSTSIDDLSRSPQGNVEDGLRLSRDEVGIVKTPAGDLKVMLDLVERPGQPAVWLFSQETLSEVSRAYASVHHQNYEEHFPQWMRIDFMSVPLWRWLMILLSVLVIFGAATLLTRCLLWLLRRISRKRLSAGLEDSVLALKMPILCLTIAILDLVAGGYAITALGRHYWKSAGLILAWVSAAWLVIRITDIVMNFVSHRLLVQMQVERATFISLLGRMFKVLVGLVLIIALLTHAGVNVSALVAGLGIGGIALALAAQKTLADLFGGLSIVMRGAVRVGDFCQIDGLTGTVEDIGISALNLRTLDRSVVSIPNAKVAEVNLENFSLRDQFWLHQVFTLRADTPHEVLKTVLADISRLLTAHSEIDKGTARARLIQFTQAGPQIEVFAYFRRTGADWAAFLEQQEKMMLDMMAAVEAAGASFAQGIDVLRMDSGAGPGPVARRS
jgi:MscS family membrane protein